MTTTATPDGATLPKRPRIDQQIETAVGAALDSLQGLLGCPKPWVALRAAGAILKLKMMLARYRLDAVRVATRVPGAREEAEAIAMASWLEQEVPDSAPRVEPVADRVEVGVGVEQLGLLRVPEQTGSLRTTEQLDRLHVCPLGLGVAVGRGQLRVGKDLRRTPAPDLGQVAPDPRRHVAGCGELVGTRGRRGPVPGEGLREDHARLVPPAGVRVGVLLHQPLPDRD